MVRIAFLVTSLSGSGHLVRTLALARATQAAGAVVRVISGGRALDHRAADDVEVVPLPPLVVHGRDFTTPRDAAGRAADAAYLAARAEAAAAAVTAFAPDVLVTETWPLGRRRLTAEFEAAIAAARAVQPGVRLAASVRDLPEPPSRPGRLTEAAARLAGFERLLVHGDPSFVILDATWPLPAGTVPLAYTGYVAGTAPTPLPRGEEVLVGVGGGDTGRRLLDLAVAAAARSTRCWRLRVGGADAGAVAARLGAGAPAHCIVEPAGADWPDRLAAAAAAVTLAGYNTAVELAQAATPALVGPDETGGQREQAARARLMAGWPGIEITALDRLDAPALAARADALAAAPRRPPPVLDTDGAARTAALLLALALEPAA
ncbi:MAG: glycosyltransferase [Paracoccaceae bacterium]